MTIGKGMVEGQESFFNGNIDELCITTKINPSLPPF
jgi:hypothetical protein